MKEKLNNKKGITLIALIITIIVLLILAIVSIKILIDQGIIGHANKAAKGYTVEQEKELIAEGYANYKMAKFASTDTTAVETLQKYFDLGLENVIDMEASDKAEKPIFIKNDIIPDADTSLSIIGEGNEYNDDNYEFFWGLSYKNCTYKVFLEEDTSTGIGMKVKKVEFESIFLDSNEETEDLELLRHYFENGGIAERKYNGELELRDNDVLKGSTEIKILGQTMTGYKIQYKNDIYNLMVDKTHSCYDNFEYRGIMLGGTTFMQDVLNVRGAKTKGNEANGWIITFDKSGNAYTMLSNGKITPGETQNPETPSTKVNLKELLDEKYGENSDEQIFIAYMEEGACKDHNTAYIYIINKKLIFYKSARDNSYLIPVENMSADDVQVAIGSNINFTELKSSKWYQILNDTSTEIFLKEVRMPNSIIYDFSEEQIIDKETYNAIISNATEMPSRTNLKELINSKFSENNTEEIKVAYVEDGSLMHKELASIRIVKRNTNAILIFNSKDEETYFMATENINTKELTTLINKRMDEKEIQPNVLYKVGRKVNSYYYATSVDQVQMPISMIEDFETEDILDRELYFAIIENL